MNGENSREEWEINCHRRGDNMHSRATTLQSGLVFLSATVHLYLIAPGRVVAVTLPSSLQFHPAFGVEDSLFTIRKFS